MESLKINMPQSCQITTFEILSNFLKVDNQCFLKNLGLQAFNDYYNRKLTNPMSQKYTEIHDEKSISNNRGGGQNA